MSQGPRGATGPVGPTGNTGPTGIQGSVHPFVFQRYNLSNIAVTTSNPVDISATLLFPTSGANPPTSAPNNMSTTINGEVLGYGGVGNNGLGNGVLGYYSYNFYSDYLKIPDSSNIPITLPVGKFLIRAKTANTVLPFPSSTSFNGLWFRGDPANGGYFEVSNSSNLNINYRDSSNTNYQMSMQGLTVGSVVAITSNSTAYSNVITAIDKTISGSYISFTVDRPIIFDPSLNRSSISFTKFPIIYAPVLSLWLSNDSHSSYGSNKDFALGVLTDNITSARNASNNNTTWGSSILHTYVEVTDSNSPLVLYPRLYPGKTENYSQYNNFTIGSSNIIDSTLLKYGIIVSVIKLF